MSDVSTVATATADSQNGQAFQTIAELNENGEMTKFIAAPFLVIVGFVALIVLLRGVQRLLGPRYFGD